MSNRPIIWSMETQRSDRLIPPPHPLREHLSNSISNSRRNVLSHVLFGKPLMGTDGSLRCEDMIAFYLLDRSTKSIWSMWEFRGLLTVVNCFWCQWDLTNMYILCRSTSRKYSNFFSFCYKTNLNFNIFTGILCDRATQNSAKLKLKFSSCYEQCLKLWKKELYKNCENQ